MKSWTLLFFFAVIFLTRAVAKPPAKKVPLTTPTPAETPAILAPGELPLTATGAIVIDAFTGQTLYEKNATQVHYPASTTKILTALLIIETGDLDKVVTVEQEDAKTESSDLLKAGEQLTRRELLYALMLRSANDAAHALARDNAGSIEAFASKMTQRARELGATSSHFMNPHGLNDLEHYTTPHDLALIARAAMQQPFFRQLVSTQLHPWSHTATVVELKNHNRLLWEFPGCTGLKTGYTRPAGNTLVSSALWGCREVIAVVMHTTQPGQWQDSKLLLTYGFEHLHE